MKAALICREMGWTYQDYRDAPQWFVVMILSMLQNEAEEMRDRTKK